MEEVVDIHKREIIRAQGGRCYRCAGPLNESNLGGYKFEGTRPFALCKPCMFGGLPNKKVDDMYAIMEGKILCTP